MLQMEACKFRSAGRCGSSCAGMGAGMDAGAGGCVGALLSTDLNMLQV